MTETLRSWIDGGFVDSSGSHSRALPDPRTNDANATVPDGSHEDVDRAVAAAKAQRGPWRNISAEERAHALHRIADGIRANRKKLMTAERKDTGKLDALLEWEIENSAAYFDFYAAMVHLPVGDVLDTTADEHTFTRREPFGVVGIITPWNLPLNQAARACAPALAAGNTVVLKPAQNSSRTSLLLAEIAVDAGLPAGVLNVLLGSGQQVGSPLVSHRDVAKVAFTGSVPVGQEIGRIAAEKIIPLTLELGGKSANIVFADADLDFAASEAVRAFTTNGGQVCSSGTRLLVDSSIHDEFVAKVSEIASEQKTGESFGPMITRAQYEQVHRYMEIAEKEGAIPVVGGSTVYPPATDSGFYVGPTIYAGVDNSMRIAREEVFGPVLAVIPFADENEAVTIANDSDFGLAAGVWTSDIARALRVSSRLEAGQVFVNTWSTASVITPFGGYKQSGYGREKGIEGLLSYTQLKTIVIKY